MIESQKTLENQQQTSLPRSSPPPESTPDGAGLNVLPLLPLPFRHEISLALGADPSLLFLLFARQSLLHFRLDQIRRNRRRRDAAGASRPGVATFAVAFAGVGERVMIRLPHRCFGSMRSKRGVAQTQILERHFQRRILRTVFRVIEKVIDDVFTFFQRSIKVGGREQRIRAGCGLQRRKIFFGIIFSRKRMNGGEIITSFRVFFVFLCFIFFFIFIMLLFLFFLLLSIVGHSSVGALFRRLLRGSP